ncbi:hypothetical protein CDAR_560411 [Caerostris darwini]|uniref:Uncharacterized protein n=1 Tax=Caerostris darwini TaxID=1538125 RepID=A0AAV4VYW9_9ARAC|nr:hypothetical protein CDAR_560151 [Caerostris darwini]GIY75680.1 hypothetical protein CDAR_560411 [Caerostris darwini]
MAISIESTTAAPHMGMMGMGGHHGGGGDGDFFDAVVEMARFEKIIGVSLLCFFVIVSCMLATTTANKLHKFFHREEDSTEELREGVRRVATPLMALAVVLKLVFEK